MPAPTDNTRSTSVTARPRRTAVLAAIAAVVASLCVVLGIASPAAAGVALSIPPDIPTNLVVGVSVPSSLTIRHQNSLGEAADPDIVSDITLVPSCGANPIGADCPVGSFDPGVLVPRGPYTGEAGTACAGMTFTVTLDTLNPAMGKYLFTTAGTIILTQTGPTSTCVIDYTIDVRKAPTIDANPGVAGVQTDQASSARAKTPNNLPGSGTGSDEGTITAGAVAINTAVNPALIQVGSTFHDVATLTSSTFAVVPTGTVRFDVYTNPTCTGTPAFTSTNPLDAPGKTATSNDFTVTTVAPHLVIATYSGDANYAPVSSLCGDTLETVNVMDTTTTTTTPPTTTTTPVTTTTAASQATTTTLIQVLPPAFGDITLPETGSKSGTSEMFIALGLLVGGGVLVGATRRRTRRS
jgi:LPXTG-motif cell wall-anchored protein